MKHQVKILTINNLVRTISFETIFQKNSLPSNWNIEWNKIICLTWYLLILISFLIEIMCIWSIQIEIFIICACFKLKLLIFQLLYFYLIVVFVRIRNKKKTILQLNVSVKKIHHNQTHKTVFQNFPKK